MERTQDADYLQALTRRISEAGAALARAEAGADEPAVCRCREDLQALCVLARRCGVYAVIGPRGGSLALTG